MKNIITALIITVSLTACTKIIDIYNNDDFEPDLVVSSITAPGDKFKVVVSKTALPRQLDTTSYITNAVVQLYEDDILLENLQIVYPEPEEQYEPVDSFFNIFEAFENFKPPYYQSEYTAEDGHNYTIKVEAIDETVLKTFSFPDKVSSIDIALDDIEIEPIENGEMENGYFYFGGNAVANIIINDPPGKNYYMIDFFNYSYIFHFDTINHVLTDSIIGQQELTLYWSFNDELSDIQYVSGDFPSGRGSGYILNDELFSEQSFSIQPELFIHGEAAADQDIVIYYNIITISEDLFRYYASKEKTNASDGNPLVEPVNLYSNIDGGNYGLITGYNVHTDSLIIVNDWE